MVLLLSYDLNGGERPASYARVRSYVEKHSISCIRPLYSQWLIETAATPQAWVDAFQTHDLIDSNDRVFVCEVRRPFQGLLTDDHWTWLNART